MSKRSASRYSAEVPDSDLDAAKKLLAEHGYVTQKATSYRSAQERQRRAEARARCEIERRESTERWARESLLPRERYLSDRLSFVYGVARAHGATTEDLADQWVRDDHPLLTEALHGVLGEAAAAEDWTVGDLAARIANLLATFEPQIVSAKQP